MHIYIYITILFCLSPSHVITIVLCHLELRRVYRSSGLASSRRCFKGNVVTLVLWTWRQKPCQKHEFDNDPNLLLKNWSDLQASDANEKMEHTKKCRDEIHERISGI